MFLRKIRYLKDKLDQLLTNVVDEFKRCLSSGFLTLESREKPRAREHVSTQLIRQELAADLSRLNGSPAGHTR